MKWFLIVVKKLKEVSVKGKREFHHQMKLLGRLRHFNVISLRVTWKDNGHVTNLIEVTNDRDHFQKNLIY